MGECGCFAALVVLGFALFVRGSLGCVCLGLVLGVTLLGFGGWIACVVLRFGLCLCLWYW